MLYVRIGHCTVLQTGIFYTKYVSHESDMNGILLDLAEGMEQRSKQEGLGKQLKLKENMLLLSGIVIKIAVHVIS